MLPGFCNALWDLLESERSCDMDFASEKETALKMAQSLISALTTEIVS